LQKSSKKGTPDITDPKFSEERHCCCNSHGCYF